MKNKSPSSSSWSIESFDVPAEEGKTRFHDLPLADPLMQAIQDLGFEYCSPIQAESLPFTLAGHDVLGRAQTGTGKTAAFLICVINDLLNNPLQGERYAGEARALVIAPTRELVLQIADDAQLLCKHTDLSVQALVGGMDYGKQKDRLHGEYADLIVATPGRLMDFCDSDDVHLDQIEFLVIDEADRMLDMGFIPQVRRIVRKSPPKENRQTLMFSATFSYDVLNLAEQWMCDHEKVEIEPKSVATDTVEQHVYLAGSEDKFMMLYNLLNSDNVENLIVFANRRDECRDLYAQLRAQGIKVGLLSGEVDQNKRVKTLDGFKSGDLQVLVATDVAGRGIHIDNISHVVNYTLPEEPEDYVHRIGRTGRAGSSGTSISFACEDDAFRLPSIEKLLGSPIVCEQPPEPLLKPLPLEATLALEEALRQVKRKPKPRAGNGRKGGGNRQSRGPR